VSDRSGDPAGANSGDGLAPLPVVRANTVDRLKPTIKAIRRLAGGDRLKRKRSFAPTAGHGYQLT
jgi:hypothetical protein